MITISVGQAILMMIKHYQNQPVMKQLLIRLYINGINTAQSLDLFKELFAQAGFTKQYEMSTDHQMINEDPTRRYFETHLAFETLKNSINELDLHRLNNFCILLQATMTAEQRELIEGYLSGEIKTQDDPFAREYLDAFKKIATDESYACFNGVQKDKLTLLLKCAWFSIVVAKTMPLNLYGIGMFSEGARGRVAKPAPDVQVLARSTKSLSQHFGLMKNYMPVPRDDVAYAEKGFEFVKPADINNVNPQAEWPQQCFSTLIHPFSCALSGTMLAQMRFMRNLVERDHTVFASQAQFKNYIRCLTSALLFNSGGHSFYEFVAVLSLPPIRQAFSECAWFSSLSLDDLLKTGNEAALSTALDDTIKYHDVLLAKKSALALLRK
jgi:hypothetical protein